jgi:hypothetical protein
MALHDAPQGKPSAGKQAVLLNRFDGIRRTRGFETAGATDKWRDQQLIGVHQGHTEA